MGRSWFRLAGKWALMAWTFPFFPCMAQHRLAVVIRSAPSSHQNEPVYITGNFNRWAPAEPGMQLKKNAEGHYSISIPLVNVPSDRLEFKFTRGNWKTLECTPAGHLEGPRTATLDKDTVIDCRIAGWRDDFPASTASRQVHLLDSAFYIPQLQRYRKVWIYLPKGYTADGRRYPVLYMQDGQDLFDEATSQGRIGPVEWGVDEVLDSARDQCIVVAVNHHDDMKQRVPEYYYAPNSHYPEVEGKAYLDFMVRTLKPYIDQHYRTLPDKKNTAMAGSSMGGLITFYCGLMYPDVFGTLGVFSPSIWLDEGNIERQLGHLDNKASIGAQRYYFYAGKSENRLKPDSSFVHMHLDVQRAIGLLNEAAHPHIDLALSADGRHGALYWRQAFPAFYEWFIKGTVAATP